MIQYLKQIGQSNLAHAKKSWEAEILPYLQKKTKFTVG